MPESIVSASYTKLMKSTMLEINSFLLRYFHETKKLQGVRYFTKLVFILVTFTSDKDASIIYRHMELVVIVISIPYNKERIGED